MHPAPSTGRLAASDLIRIRPRPGTVYISRGRCVLATAVDGTIDGHPDHGFFVHETRVLSRWQYRFDGDIPWPNASSCVHQDHWLGYFILAAPGVPLRERDEGSGQVPPASQNTLELRVTRTVDDALHEHLAITNYTSATTSFTFEIDCDADFADQAETRERQQFGETSTRVDGDTRTIDYTSGSLHRAVTIAPANLRFPITLGPHETWRQTITVKATWLEPTVRVEEDTRTTFDTPTLTTDVLATLAQARTDLESLRLFEPDTVAAGLPLYIALFGRDTLTAGWQAALLGPDLMSGTLGALAELQGTRDDPWRDERPGKMLHEAHTGPLSMLNLNPRGRSYSSITTSGLYAFILAELWHWTGDKDLVRPFVEPALRALQWLDRDGDLDSDGFYEYKTRSPMGPRHQAWKDSPDAIVDEDGRDVEPPIATCEEQAFVYVAKLHLAETLWWLGERTLSKRIYHQASELKKRFNEAFWMEDEGFYAMALDAQKHQVRSIASNAGHCLAAAISDAALVPRIADRLFQDDLFSGWGIRTLSSNHPRYNPYSYHLGSIWPVEHGTFAIGLMRYGLYDRVHQIARAQFEAASLFEFHRLPELFGGHPRDADHPFPAIYPNVNSPQAWSASAVFSLLQAMLGLYPYAPLKMLVVDPHLPDWLPEITLRDLRVGKARVTIHFHRGKSGRTTYRILDKRGTLHVVRQATPWSLTTQPAERLRDALASLKEGL
ncbi:MAG TPA: glycogen debranching N-terminal domain-containing protein [Thermoanaerobaculia bacterium]|jgi:glycogen debranching enzyme